MVAKDKEVVLTPEEEMKKDIREAVMDYFLWCNKPIVKFGKPVDLENWVNISDWKEEE